MKHSSIFTATAVKQDPITGDIITVTYHPDGHITSREDDGAEYEIEDPEMTLVNWVNWMRKNGYTVTVRDATYEEIKGGTAVN